MPQQILLVDDADATRAPLADLLRRRGYVVREASNGEEGLRTLRDHPQTTVVVLDLLMPRADGWWFREQQLQDPAIADIPVLVFSVSGKADMLKYTLKVREVLHKPASIDELFEAIEACCGSATESSR